MQPSVQSVLQGQYQPLSRPLFIYVNDQALLDSAEVRNFTTFLIRNAPALVAKTNYIPFPDSTIRLVETKLYRHVLACVPCSGVNPRHPHPGVAGVG